MGIIQGKRVVITGGTGSLGRALTRRLLLEPGEKPARVIIFSRDEAKQHRMRLEYLQRKNVTDEVIYQDAQSALEFRIGDVRDYASVCDLLKNADVVVHAAALKQVPSCEYHPYEAVRTNICGAENMVRALRENDFPVSVVVGVSTDKACKPVNVMGMTKALQERILQAGNLGMSGARFVCVRIGNVLASRGSVIPLFQEQVRNGGPVTITSGDMTRFMLSVDRAVDTILEAINRAGPGETVVPIGPAARIVDLARAIIGSRDIQLVTTGIRPGEKIHEILVSEEETGRTGRRGDYYFIQPLLPELRRGGEINDPRGGEYSSLDSLLDVQQISDLLRENHLISGRETGAGEEYPR